MTTAVEKFSLEQFKTEGYTGPIAVLNAEEARAVYERFFAEIGQSPGAPGPTKAYLSAWQLRLRWAYELATHPRVLDAMEGLLGPDLVLWAMHWWYKEPGNGKRIPWHQDGHYWPMAPKKNVTAWFAVGPTFKANGCLRIVPGSHKTTVKHENLGDKNSHFAEGIPVGAVDESKALDVEMNPGEAVFFNEATFHGSEPNTSDVPRVAFSLRYTTPEVKFLTDQWSDAGRIRPILVRGTDRYKVNAEIMGAPPA